MTAESVSMASSSIHLTLTLNFRERVFYNGYVPIVTWILSIPIAFVKSLSNKISIINQAKLEVDWVTFE